MPAEEVFDTSLVAGIDEAVRSVRPVDALNRALLSRLLAWTMGPDALRDAGRAIAHRAARLTIDELAAACSSSQRKLQRDFRRILDATPIQMIARVRFERARRLVMDKELPLAQVAADAGYVDQSHLNRAFARFARMTPREYRDQFQRVIDQGGDVALIQE